MGLSRLWWKVSVDRWMNLCHSAYFDKPIRYRLRIELLPRTWSTEYLPFITWIVAYTRRPLVQSCVLPNRFPHPCRTAREKSKSKNKNSCCFIERVRKATRPLPHQTILPLETTRLEIGIHFLCTSGVREQPTNDIAPFNSTLCKDPVDGRVEKLSLIFGGVRW